MSLNLKQHMTLVKISLYCILKTRFTFRDMGRQDSEKSVHKHLETTQYDKN